MVWRGLTGWGAVVGAALALVLGSPMVASAAGDYSSAPFTVSTHNHTFGQAAVFMPDGRVVAGENLGNGKGGQVYVSNQDGSAPRCLTCSMAAPNGVPAVRPQGDWVLFHSWNGHKFTLGAPGFGGIGSELWVTRPDGTGATQLTGTSSSDAYGEGIDDYHAYWSPDGKRIAWAHFNGQFVFTPDGWQGRWDIRVADFDPNGGHPKLTNIRVVRPANGHWYETQWWAPDGSGFLYTETWGTTMNTELFFCHLTVSGCQVTRLTDNPAWDEQALFTPDGKDVIFMSSRDHPGFYNTFSALAYGLGLPSNYDNILVLPVFEASFEQPVAGEATDLYELDLATGAVRRLTTDGNDGWVTPEFAWDPTNRFLMWTEFRIPPGERVPEPIDLARQLNQEAELLRHPPPPNLAPLLGGNALVAVAPVESRTRILRFDLGAGGASSTPVSPGCVPTPKLSFVLHHQRGARVVKAEVFVDGRRVLARRGRALRRIAFARPHASRFVVEIVATESNGTTLTTTRSYSGCSASVPRTRVRAARQ